MLLKFLILLYFKGMQCSFLLLCLEHHFIHNDMYYRQKQVSRRCMNKSRAQFNRRIEQLEKDLENERRRANRYKKRHQRAPEEIRSAKTTYSSIKDSTFVTIYVCVYQCQKNITVPQCHCPQLASQVCQFEVTWC